MREEVEKARRNAVKKWQDEYEQEINPVWMRQKNMPKTIQLPKSVL